jgi:hypothetical protein
MFESLERRRESFWRELGAFTVTQVPAGRSSFSESSITDTNHEAQPTHAPHDMSKSLRVAVAALGHDISRDLPPGNSMSAELTELLLTGLALQHRVPMLRIATLLRGMSALKFRLGISRALSDPDTSVWYFERLESFSERFRLLLKIDENQSAALAVNHQPNHPGAAGEPSLQYLPVMPVYREDDCRDSQGVGLLGGMVANHL